MLCAASELCYLSDTELCYDIRSFLLIIDLMTVLVSRLMSLLNNTISVKKLQSSKYFNAMLSILFSLLIHICKLSVSPASAVETQLNPIASHPYHIIFPRPSNINFTLNLKILKYIFVTSFFIIKLSAVTNYREITDFDIGFVSKKIN